VDGRYADVHHGQHGHVRSELEDPSGAGMMDAPSRCGRPAPSTFRMTADYETLTRRRTSSEVLVLKV